MSNNDSSWSIGTGPLPKPQNKVTQAFKRWFAIPAYILNIGTNKGAGKVKDVFNANARLYLAIQFARNKSNLGFLRVTVKNTDLMEMAALNEFALIRARKALVNARLITAMPTDGRNETYEYEFPSTLDGFEEQDAEPITDVDVFLTPIPREVMMATLTSAPQGIVMPPAGTQTQSKVAPPLPRSTRTAVIN
jgi:hypothetical protein